MMEVAAKRDRASASSFFMCLIGVWFCLFALGCVVARLPKRARCAGAAPVKEQRGVTKRRRSLQTSLDSDWNGFIPGFFAKGYQN